MPAASDASSLASSASYNSADFRPNTPPPPARPWKYLEHPDADEWLRGPREEHNYPNLGDFVVLSIDPLATVGHLDAIAKRAAQQLPIRKYVALALQSFGLPLSTKPTHSFDFMFVRKGRPQPRLRELDTEDSCISILPNDTAVSSCPPVRPAHPLPWGDCYLDATYGFPQSCRVTSTRRDYVPVLPILDSEVIRITSHLRPYWSKIHDLNTGNGANWSQPLDFVSPAPLSSKECSADGVPAPSEGAHPSVIDSTGNLRVVSVDKAEPNPNSAQDDVSVIASDDGARNEPEPDTDAEEDLDMLLNFESMMMDAGEVRDPVVNVCYNLDVVTEIVDPVHFLEDVKRLHMIMDEAEIRLGLRPDPAATEALSEHSSIVDDHGSQRSVDRDAATSAPSDVVQESAPETLTSRPAARGLRAGVNRAALKLFSYTRSLVQKLPSSRHRKMDELERDDI
ncbi:unnamed protein product [Peniophora sp. CBMAI 1063]|nr:unnamed protein product [Peniophora sp. CBMAI 1063]